MKKVVFFSFLCIVLNASAQNTSPFPENGNVGIGTTIPAYELEVNGTIKSKALKIDNDWLKGDILNFASTDDRREKCLLLNVGTIVGPRGFGRIINFSDFPKSNLDSKPRSWFAINDRNSAARLSMSSTTGGASSFILRTRYNSPYFKVFEYPYGFGQAFNVLEMPKPNSRLRIGASINEESKHMVYVKGGSSLFEGNILTTSKIGVGIIPGGIPADYQLAIAGKIIAEEVKVELQSTGWPDYVFKNTYKLPTLQNLENYIKTKGHLPNIPSASEVKKNGIELGGMNAKLLEKIEELTLYTIQQQKDLEAQKEKNTTLEERLAKIEVLLESIQK